MNSFLIRSCWYHLWGNVWSRLSKKSYAPENMFLELYTYEYKKLKLKIVKEVYDNPKLAQEQFRLGIVPIHEKTCIALLEGFYDVLSNFDAKLCRDYRNLLNRFIERYNLRYFLTADCKIRLSLVGLIVSQYALLRKSVSTNQLRNDCLVDLEKNVGLFQEDTAESNCIRVANNLLEGVAVDKATNGATTFGRALDGCRNIFPHQALIDSAKSFYEFFSDFPNLRHGGTTLNPRQIRNIKKDDAIFSLSFAVILSSFIADNDASQDILDGNF